MCTRLLHKQEWARCEAAPARLQAGYNFLYGLWKYSWDADCELFLKILQEEIKEDVYTQQVLLQASALSWGSHVPLVPNHSKHITRRLQSTRPPEPSEYTTVMQKHDLVLLPGRVGTQVMPSAVIRYI